MYLFSMTLTILIMNLYIWIFNTILVYIFGGLVLSLVTVGIYEIIQEEKGKLKKTAYIPLRIMPVILVLRRMLSANAISKLLNFLPLKLKILVQMDMICFSISLKGNWIAG